MINNVIIYRGKENQLASLFYCWLILLVISFLYQFTLIKKKKCVFFLAGFFFLNIFASANIINIKSNLFNIQLTMYRIVILAEPSLEQIQVSLVSFLPCRSLFYSICSDYVRSSDCEFNSGSFSLESLSNSDSSPVRIVSYDLDFSIRPVLSFRTFEDED